VDNHEEARRFLTSRRAKVGPELVGISVQGSRRVPGLRRAEVAQLAGISAEYYAKLERGHLSGVSAGVLDAIANALRLDDAERAYLDALAQASDPDLRRRPVPSVSAEVRQNVRRLIDAMGVPAFIVDVRTTVLAANPLGRVLYAPLFRAGEVTPNHARFNFCDPHAPLFWGDWEHVADESVAMLRANAGRNPGDKGLARLIEELLGESEEFRVRWARHDVHDHRTGLKHLRHPVVGDLYLTFEILYLVADDALALLAYGTEEGSESEDRLRILAGRIGTAASPSL
jgi:transcriptional regulator with XRE-family HTH domain